MPQLKLISVLSVLFALGGLSSLVALADVKAKIVKSKNCNLAIKGGDWEVDDELVFRGLNKGRTVNEKIVIKKVLGKGKFVGRPKEEHDDCDFLVGARFDPDETQLVLLDNRLFLQTLQFGYLNIATTGFEFLKPRETVSSPSLGFVRLHTEVFPSSGKATEASLRLFGVTLDALYGSSSVLGGDSTFADGSTAAASFLSAYSAIAGRAYFIGDPHPSVAEIGYIYLRSDFTKTKGGDLELLPIRPLKCSGPLAKITQNFGVTEYYQISAWLNVSFAQACTTEPIDLEKAIGVEVSGSNKGKEKAEQIATFEKTSGSQQLGFGILMRRAIGAGVGVELGITADRYRGEFKTRGENVPYVLTQNTSFFGFNYSIK